MKQVILLFMILVSALVLYLGYSERFAYFNGLVAEAAGWDAKALVLYQKGCHQGNFASCMKVGEKYESGIGCMQDPAEAVKIYQKASSEGYIPAETKLKGLKDK